MRSRNGLEAKENFDMKKGFILPRRDELALAYGADRPMSAICAAERMDKAYRAAQAGDGVDLEITHKAHQAVVMLFQKLPYEPLAEMADQQLGLLRKLLKRIDKDIVASADQVVDFEGRPGEKSGFFGGVQLRDLRREWLCTKTGFERFWKSKSGAIQITLGGKAYIVEAYPARLRLYENKSKQNQIWGGELPLFDYWQAPMGKENLPEPIEPIDMDQINSVGVPKNASLA